MPALHRLTRQLRSCLPVLVAVAALCAVACGPINASTAVGDAQTAVDDATAANAARLAPYKYWLAVSYLEKAKRTEGYSEFQDAAAFADKAQDYAQDAVEAAQLEQQRRRTLQERLRQRSLEKSR